MVFLVLGVTGIFTLYPGLFECYGKRIGVLFEYFFNFSRQAIGCLGLANKPWPAPVGCRSQGQLFFEPLQPSGSFSVSGALGAPTCLCW